MIHNTIELQHLFKSHLIYKESENKGERNKEGVRRRKGDRSKTVSLWKKERKKWNGTTVAGRHAVIKESSCCSVSWRDDVERE